ncbi:hypothetical protein [Pararhodobacter oceanensis]|uniref:hypothetical protein n=1 Tax=Pararhodobacter oceanensis TaxID=2172121 RepID=UPI003A92C0B6
MRLLLHIGAPKAGSSSIQSALIANAKALREQGVMAWTAPSDKGPPPLTLANRFKTDERPLRPRERLHFTNRQQARDWSLQVWAQLARHLAAQQPELTVLSSEAFLNIGAVPKVLEVLEPLFSEVHILVYIRDPVDQYRSTLDQRIRDGDRFADLPLPHLTISHWHRIVQRYRKLLGPERVIMRGFHRQAFIGGDLIADLAAQIGAVLGREVVMPTAVAATNESLCAPATLWLLAANEAFVRFATGDDSELIRRRLLLVRRLAAAPALQDLPKLTPPPELIAALLRQNHAAAIAFFNNSEAGKRHPLRMPAPDIATPEDSTIRAALRDWLLPQAKPDDLRKVLEAAIATG